MSAIIKFLILSAAIIIPWGLIRVTDLEMKVRTGLHIIGISDLGIIAILVIPPIAWFFTKWLFGPRGKQSKRYSASKNIIFKFRG